MESHVPDEPQAWLPYVKDEFFRVAADLMFWERVRDLAPWSADCLPLADWQGILYVACADSRPNAEFETRLRHAAKEAFCTDLCFVKAKPENLHDLWQALHSANPPETSEAPTIELPDGLSATAAGISLDFSSLSGGGAPVQSARGDLPEPSISKVRVRTAVSPAFDREQTHPGFAVTPPVESLAQCLSYDDAAGVALGTILTTFEYGMILLFRGGAFRPWKWTRNFAPQVSEPSIIDLTKPSAFRVAYRTCLPYHGYVVASDENTKFFSEWLGGALPKHLTLIPLTIDGKLCGMALGITNGEIAYKSSLSAMESLGRELSQTFARLQTATVKAA